MLFHNMSSSETTGNFSAAHTQCFTENAGLQLQITVSAFPAPPHSDSGEGDCFRGLTTVRLRYDLLLCLPSLSELTGLLSIQRARLLPGFKWFGHPFHRRISLQRQLGNLRWRDFHPLDHRLASLHYLAPSAPLAGTSGFHRLAAYTRCLRCAYSHMPRRPTTGSEVSLMVFRNMSPSETTGNSSAAFTQYLTEDSGLQLQNTVSAFPSSSHSDSREGVFSGLSYGSLALRPVALLALLSEQTRFAPGLRGRLLPGFRRFGHPRRRRISLQCQLGNLHWRDSRPLDHQLASPHVLDHSAPLVGS